MKYLTTGKFRLLYTYLSRCYGRKFIKEKGKGSNRDVSTVVLRVFLFRIFPFILLTSNSMISRAILKPCYYLYEDQ